MKKAFYFFQILLAGFLLFSAYRNLFPIEYIEARIVDQTGINWIASVLVIRLFVGIKFLVALLLLLNINYKRIPFVFASLVLLVHVFDSVYNRLASDYIVAFPYSFFFGPHKVLSFVVTFFFLLLSLFLLVKKTANDWKYKWVKWIALAVTLPLPFIFNPIYIDDISDQSITVNEKVDFSRFEKQKGYTKNRQLIALLSSECPHCLDATQRLLVTRKKNKNFIATYAFMLGDENSVNTFFSLAGGRLNYSLLSPEEIFPLAGNAFPAFVLLENNTIIKRWKPGTFNYYELENLEN